MTNGCCVKGDDVVIETLSEHVVSHGYEFPILRKMNDTENVPPPADSIIPNAAMRNMLNQKAVQEQQYSKSYGGVGSGPDNSDMSEFTSTGQSPGRDQGQSA